MSVSQSVNGTSYALPTAGDTDWGALLTTFLQGLAASFSSVFTFGNSVTAAGSGFVAPGLYSTVTGATEAFYTVPMAGRLKALYCKSAGAPAGGTVVFTVRINGVDTALLCTLADGATTASDIVNSVVVAAGSTLSMKCVSTAATQPTFPVLTMAFVPG